jgi:UDP-3-O-acyl-N-acetylglucosamine deacetylase
MSVCRISSLFARSQEFLLSHLFSVDTEDVCVSLSEEEEPICDTAAHLLDSHLFLTNLL